MTSLEVTTTVAEIRGLHRRRCFMMEQRKRANLALGAFIRTSLGWRKDLPADQRKAIESTAHAILANPADARGAEWKDLIETSQLAIAPFDAAEAKAVKAMVKFAKQLPVWASFVHDIRGFGERGLAVIIGEAGDLSKYDNHSKLWKRMGLAVFDGVRQGGLKKGASAEDWIAHGYSKVRRSRMWTVGEAMIKAQVRKVKDAAGEDTGERTSLGLYGQIYLDRKAYELARDPEMIPMHAHRRAQRYMEKKLLRDLWRAWRQADIEVPSQANLAVPAADDLEVTA